MVYHGAMLAFTSQLNNVAKTVGCDWENEVCTILYAQPYMLYFSLPTRFIRRRLGYLTESLVLQNFPKDPIEI